MNRVTSFLHGHDVDDQMLRFNFVMPIPAAVPRRAITIFVKKFPLSLIGRSRLARSLVSRKVRPSSENGTPFPLTNPPVVLLTTSFSTSTHNKMTDVL